MANGTTNFHEELLEALPTDPPRVRGGVVYRERLQQLALIVRRDLPQIQITFPEFTPHDWNMHIVPLFDLAERLFGGDALLALNDLDKFLLVAGLYGHDWGMAVGQEERAAIAAGAKPSDGNSDYVLLPDEPEVLTGFARRQGLKKDRDGGFPSLLDDALPHWAEYVRQTHAWRSGVRVRRILLAENGDRALGEAGWAVCAGHWLDFNQLRDSRIIQPVRMVGGTRAHPRLVALIVRLTDLFDIGRDRTPYALRRFIGPSDPRSVTEWDKHDALDPVDCVGIIGDKGRHQVVVRGTCENAALWPALIDLRDYLEDQLQYAIGLLTEENATLTAEPTPGSEPVVVGQFSRINPVLQWDVQPQGFKPSEVRFEFDRAATFRILAEEIYGKEPHIFLRELLQNSLDATRQLCARENQRSGRRALEPRDLLIRFQVSRHADGRTTVTCRDYGIGMNEHIVSTYMARIGASYYTSTEYIHDQLSMHAVSRFGIGLLSCFMVTDKVRVRTKRPEIYEGDQGLIVEVPGIDRHFQIYPLDDPGWEGTEVCVDVLPTKLAAFADNKGNIPEFDVLQYVLRTAGFIDVPIYVEDGEKSLLILHPDMDPTLRPAGVPENVKVHQLRGAYRWPEELQRFEMCPDPTVLSDYRVDISKDLKLPNVAGFVTFPIPCPVGGDLSITSNGLLRGENLMVQIVGDTEATPVFAKSIGIGVRYPAAANPSSSNQPKAPNVLIYQDGIYVTGTGEIGKKIGDDPFPAHAWIDYRSSARAELTPSRNSMARDPKDSPEWIVIKARTHAFFLELGRARLLAPVEKIRKLVQLEKFLGVGNGSIVENLPWQGYPVFVLHPSGNFQYVAAKDTFVNGIRTFPLALQTPGNAAQAIKALANVMPIIARGYRGGPWLFEFPMHHRGETVVQQSAAMLQHVFIHNALWPVALCFVTLPQPSEGPRPQEIYIPRHTAQPEDVRPLMAKALVDPRALTVEEWGRLRVGNSVDGGNELTRRVFDFPHPFTNSFAYGLEYFNLQHPAVYWLVKLVAAATAAGGINADSVSPAGRAMRWISSLRTQNAEFCYEMLGSYWQGIASFVNGLASIADQTIPPCPNFDEFVAGSFSRTKRELFERKQTQQPLNFLTAEPWGHDYRV